jgi:hypothetical protein
VRLSVVDGNQSRTGRCGDGDKIVEEEVAPESPRAVEATEVSEAPAIEATVLSEPPAHEVLPASDDTIAVRFAVAFQPETWQEAEFAKVIAAFAPRLAALRRSRRARAAIPWPARDGMTPIRLTPTLIAYAWSSELSLPDPAGFKPAAAATHLSQLTR